MNLDVATVFSREAHKNQLDKSGFDYFTPLLRSFATTALHRRSSTGSALTIEVPRVRSD